MGDQKKTSYVVLGSRDKHAWQVIGTAVGQGQTAALRKFLDDRGDVVNAAVDGGSASFVAVPERSWQPVTPVVKVVTRYSLASATAATDAPAQAEPVTS